MALFVTSKRSNVRLGEIVERREGEFEGSPVFRCIVTWTATARGGPPPEVSCQLLDARNHRRLEQLLGRPVEQMLDEWHVFFTGTFSTTPLRASHASLDCASD